MIIVRQENYLKKPFNPQTRTNDLDESNLESVMENVVGHFANTFNRSYPEAGVKLLIRAILKDRPIVFEGISFKQGQKMEPTIALPEARKYFQKQVEAGKLQLSVHCVLVKEALTVLGREGKRELLKQLLWGEFNEVMISAQSERSPWLMKNLNPDGWIDMSEELLFQSINRAMAGILTIVATLPWQMQRDLRNQIESC